METQCVKQLGTPGLGQLKHLGVNRQALKSSRVVIVLREHNLFHLNEIDKPAELRAFTYRNLDGDSLEREILLQRENSLIKISSNPVHLVDEGKAGHPVFIQLAVYCFALGLGPGNRINGEDRSIENTAGALHLCGEVNVAGSIDQVEFIALPLKVGGRRSNGDSTFLLFLHEIHGGLAIMNLTKLVDLAADLQHPLCDGGLAAIDVGYDPDVPDPLSHDFLTCN